MVKEAAKRLLGKCLRRIRGIYLYRKIARLFSPQIEICEAKKEDVESIQKFFHLKVDNPLAQRIAVTDFVAKIKDKVVGFVQLVRHPQDSPYAGYWLFSMTVSFFYRRMGIGERLTQAVIEKAIAEEAKKLSLLVFEDNREAIRLYRKLGFKFMVVAALEEELKREKMLYHRRRVIMSKNLD
jgi:ribosomal protein S18 acetylase RimI-like enzyme